MPTQAHSPALNPQSNHAPEIDTVTPRTETEQYPLDTKDGAGMTEVHGTDTNSGSSLDEKRKQDSERYAGQNVVPPHDGAPAYVLDEEGHAHLDHAPETAADLTTTVLDVTDDMSLNPWTFRMAFLGCGLSIFGSTLATIYYFKPQYLLVSVIFLAVISYVLGELMALIIPRWGPIGRFLNPGPFNSKEHAAIVIMASAASNCALGVEALAVQRLFYPTSPNGVASVFLLFASQFLGYGLGGLLRRTLVFPTKMLYPVNLPLNNLISTLHNDKQSNKKRLQVFYLGFGLMFVWEVLPQYMMPILTGVSIFCLAKRDSLVFTNLFGGSNGNEGLGFLSFCFDWQYISAAQNPLWFPLRTLVNLTIGYFICIAIMMGLYYNNIWNAQNFPFLSQLLFTAGSNSTVWQIYPQEAILNAQAELDPAALAQVGLPQFAASYVVSLLTTNMALTATITHLLLWNYDDMKGAWAFLTPSAIKSHFTNTQVNWKFWQKRTQAEKDADPELDPHYRLVLKYDECPNWWYFLLLIASFIIGIVTLYSINSTLPWWGYIISVLVATVFLLFFTAMYAITGFGFLLTPIVQLIGGYLHPGKPLANLYFTLFGYNSVQQGALLLKDLKFAQYAHLSPKCTFTVQMVGTLLGAAMNYVMMISIVDNQRDILTAVQGTNIWSGQNVQQYNSQAIAWGALAKYMFNAGAEYMWVPLGLVLGFAAPVPFWILHKIFPKGGFWYFNTAVISFYSGFLATGINSSQLMFFIVGYTSQLYMRKYHSEWFIKYNYILSAALDGGMQVIVFILTFAVQGASGNAVPFPSYWGNNFYNPETNPTVNFDYCMYNNAAYE